MTKEEIEEIFGVKGMGMGEVHFKDGIVFRCEIDITNWVNKPVIDLTKAIEER